MTQRLNPSAKWTEPATSEGGVQMLVGFVYEPSPGSYAFTTDRNLWTHSISRDDADVWTVVPKDEVVNRVLILYYSGSFHVG